MASKQAEAKLLNGTDIGAELYHKARNFIGWDDVNKTFEYREYERWSTVLTVTHKKNGLVRVRTTYGEHVFKPEAMILLREKD